MGPSPSKDEAAPSALDLNSSAAAEATPSAPKDVHGVGQPPPKSITTLPDVEASTAGVVVVVSKKERSENAAAVVTGAEDRAQSVGVDQKTEHERVDGRGVQDSDHQKDRLEASFILEQREVKTNVVLDINDEGLVDDEYILLDDLKIPEQKKNDTMEAEVKDATSRDMKSESKDSKSEYAGAVVSDGDADMQVEEQEQPKSAVVKTVKRSGVKRRASVMETDQCARYRLLDQERQVGFAVSDLVWGKVRSHPWWPGQLCDPKDASELALKIMKKNDFLVAYFGDKTFAWCEESQLKPFWPYFSQMSRQSSTDALLNAVNAVLEEASRSVELGLTCSCVPAEACAKLKEQKVDNAGIREGACCLAADRSQIVAAFQPDRLIEFIQDLAVFPSGGADRLDLVTAKAQLKVFYQLKGYSELPTLLDWGGLVESDSEIAPSKAKKSRKHIVDQSTLTLSDLTSGKRKQRGSSSLSNKKKNVVDASTKKRSLSELMEEEDDPQLANGGKRISGEKSDGRSTSHSFGKEGKVVTVDSGKRKRKRLASLGDVKDKKHSPPLGRSLKVGDSIRRVASKMTGSPPIFKSNSERSQRSSAKAGRIKGGASNDRMPGSSVKTGRNKRGASRDYPPSSEVLSQLCLLARDPIKGYSFLTVIDSFFTDFRDYVASGFSSSSSMDMNHVEGTLGGRGRRNSNSSKSASAKMSASDWMQDSYWSDVIFQSSPEKEPLTNGQKRKRKSQLKREKKKKKKKTAVDMSLSPSSSSLLNTLQGTKVGSGSPNVKEDLGQLSNVGEDVDKCKPTALILSFTESSALPSETDLINFFTRYGSLEESETEVLRKTNRAKVVFKKLADAELAFSSAGKYSIFGPALVSYSLKYLSSTLQASPITTPQVKKDASTVEGVDLEVSAEEEIGVVSDKMQVEDVAQGTSE